MLCVSCDLFLLRGLKSRELLWFVLWECLLHLCQVFLVRKESLEERITLDHGIPIRSAAPKKVKFELILIKYNPVIGGVGKDEFLLLWGGGQMMLSSKEKEGSCG